MSWRGGGRGGGNRGFGGRSGGNRNSFGGRGGRNFDQGPPEQVIPLGFYDYTVQDDLVCKVEIEEVPFFNAPIYLENKEQIGKIDEIFGHLRDYYVTIRLGDNMKANSFKKNQKLFIDPAKLLPLQRFLPRAPGSISKRGRGRGRGGRDGRGAGFGRGAGRGFGRGREGGFGRGRGSAGFRGRDGGNRNSFGGGRGNRGRFGRGGS